MISNSPDLNTIFATVTEETAQLLKIPHCCVVQYLSQLGVWRHLAEFRRDRNISTAIGIDLPDAENPFAEQLKQFQIVRLENTANLEDESNRQLAETFPGAWLLIPLTVNGTIWGALTILGIKKPGSWYDASVKIAKAIAKQLEIAIRQADLYQQAQLELAGRRRVEIALRESEARFKNMAANVPGVIVRYVLRPDGSDAVTYISPGGYSLWEIKASRILADTAILWQMIHPENSQSLKESIIKSGENLKSWNSNWRITTPSGREKWLQGAGKPTKQDNGDIVWDILILDVSERQQAEVTIQRESAFRQQILENISEGLCIHYQIKESPFVRFTLWNRQMLAITGYTLEEINLLGWFDVLHPNSETGEKAIARYQRMLLGEHLSAEEWEIQRQDGQVRTVSLSTSYSTNYDGLTHVLLIIKDVSDRKQAEAALRESEARYRLVTENMNDLVCVHELEGLYLYVSSSCQALLGYSAEEMLGQNPYSFFHPEDCGRIYQEHMGAIAGNSEPITYRIRQKSGAYIWFETLTKAIKNDSSQIVRLQTTSRDVSERIQVQERLKHDALHDTLTGLPNRTLLMERLELAINRVKRCEQHRFAVLFLDLNRFKIINDSLGHLAGDRLLIFVAQKLQFILRSSDFAARLGGDEFIVLLEDIKTIQEAVSITERIFAELQRPLIVEGRELYTTCSVGIVLGDNSYQHASDLLRDADFAMYRAKNRGEAEYEIFLKN